MATRISKFSSLQSGPFNVANNILDIDVQGSFADLTQSYISLKVDIQTTEGPGPNVQGVHKVNLLYDAASFVRHCHVSFERLGIVEETQFNNIFNYNYDKMKKTYQMQRNDTTNGRTYAYFDDEQYFLAPDVLNTDTVAGMGTPVYSPFRLIYQDGSTPSAPLQPELRIMCSQLFGIGAIDMLPMLALGKMRIHLELENVLTLVQETPQVIGGYACRPITTLTAANPSVTVWNWYGITATTIPWATGDALAIQYQFNPDTTAPGAYRTYILSNTVGATTVNGDGTVTITLGKQIPAIGGANAATQNVVLFTTPAAGAVVASVACADVAALAARITVTSAANLAAGASPIQVGPATVNYTVGGVAYSQAVIVTAIAANGADAAKLDFTFRNALEERIIAGDASLITLTNSILSNNDAPDRLTCLDKADAGPDVTLIGTFLSSELLPIWVGELVSVFYVNTANPPASVTDFYRITKIAWVAGNNAVKVTLAAASATAAAVNGGSVPQASQIFIKKVQLEEGAQAGVQTGSLSWQVTKAQFVLYETMLPPATAKQIMGTKNIIPFMSKRVEQFYMPSAIGQWSKMFDLEPGTVAAFIMSSVGFLGDKFLDMLRSTQDTESGFRFSLQGPGVTTDLTDQDILPWSGLYNDRLVAAMQASGMPCRNLAEYIFTMATAIPQLSQQQQLQLRQVLSAASTAKNMYLFKIIRRALMIDGGKVSLG